jgi:hypothetical protein
LNRLTERTGGQVLRADATPDASQEAADALFGTPGQSLTALQEYWPWFVILALVLFVADIAVRQLLASASVVVRRPPRPAEVETEPDYTYDELATIVHRRAEENRRRGVLTRDARDIPTAAP